MTTTPALHRTRCYELYSQSTGVEIRETVKTHEEGSRITERTGRIMLSFFKLTPRTRPDETTQIRFICEPDEAWELGTRIGRLAGATEPAKEKLSPHRFTGNQGGETVTTVTAEKWARGGKSGFALTIGRGDDFISVPIPAAKFAFAGEFLRSLAIRQCWVEQPERPARPTPDGGSCPG